MNPEEKGWLSEYFSFKKSQVQNLTAEEIIRTSHPEYSLYRIIQPTGLMYGHTIGVTKHPAANSWKERAKMKVMLADCLISSSLLFHPTPIKNSEEFIATMELALENIVKYYNNIFPEIATSSKTLFGKRLSTLQVAEKILDKRIDKTHDFTKNFWTGFFHNSLLFLDVFLFTKWLHTKDDHIVIDFFRYEREELRFSVAKIIAAAAHSNHVVASEERKFFEYFIQSTDLPSRKRKEALKIFEEGVLVEDINVSSENSWLLKKFFLEVAILTLWADKEVQNEELVFINSLCSHFRFSQDDLENSMIAIEGFVLEHWIELDHLQNKHNYEVVSNQFISRVANIAEKNLSRLKGYFNQSEHLPFLMAKAEKEELTPPEKELLRQELIKMLGQAPTFNIISLPQTFLSLPVLMKIIPPEIFRKK